MFTAKASFSEVISRATGSYASTAAAPVMFSGPASSRSAHRGCSRTYGVAVTRKMMLLKQQMSLGQARNLHRECGATLEVVEGTQIYSIAQRM